MKANYNKWKSNYKKQKDLNKEWQEIVRFQGDNKRIRHCQIGTMSLF